MHRPTPLSALRGDLGFAVGERGRQRAGMSLPRKRRFRAPVGWSRGLEGLHDYMQPQPRRRQSARSNEAKSGAIIVTDDWPEHVPIGDAELRVVEGGLREELNALFGPLR